MRKTVLAVFALWLNLYAAAQLPPAIRKEPKVFNEHGYQRVDDYFWLANSSDSNVINILKAENAYVDAYLKNTEALQKKLYDELVGRIPGRDESLPVKRNGYWYYSRFEEGKQYPSFIRRKGTMRAQEEVMLDVPRLAANHKIFLLRGSAVSPDNTKFIYGVDTLGDRRATLYIKELGSGRILPELIPNASGSIAWLNDNRSFYYVINDHTVRAFRVMHHTLGTDPSSDREVYTEKDSTYSVSVRKSKNGKYIFIQSNSTNTTEARWIDADRPGSPVLVQKRTEGIEYYPSYHEGNVFHIYTNYQAKNYKFVLAPIITPGIENWKDVVSGDKDVFLEGVEVLRDYYVVQTKENGLTQIKVIRRKTGKSHNIDFGQKAYVAGMSVATDEYVTDSIRFNFTSLTTPSTTFKYNLKTGHKTPIKRQYVGGGYEPELYHTDRIWSTATDGTKVPVSIVYRKDKFRKDGTMPMLLYSYGSYGSNSDPYFNSSVISLLDRGAIFAIAHIRGGQELGREWYEQGRVLNKKNTFTDFVDAAQFLVTQKYTSTDRLFINGGSAGGMLMGAVTNMRPDLFRGVIAEVPWMDVITDMFDPSIPLVTLEYDEWGNPNKKEHYEYLRTWSPLDNVKPAKYPAILATAGLHDTQVPYSSPAKWVARIRENNLGNNPVLFQVNMGAGHGGESGRYARQKLTALKYGFILDQLGWNETKRTFNVQKPL